MSFETMSQHWLQCLKPGLVLLICLIISGCATPPRPGPSVHINAPGERGHCAQFFLTLDLLTDQTHSLDAGDGRVEGYPYLRVNRLLASFRNETADSPAFNTWLDHLQKLDLKARSFEISNLPMDLIQQHFSGMNIEALNSKVRDCGDLLKGHDFKQPAQRQQLKTLTFVDTEYHPLPQALGIYPLSRLLVTMGVNKWQTQARKAFSNHPPQYAHSQHYIYSGPRPTLSKLQQMLQSTPQDVLGIPRYSSTTLDALFARYSPAWIVKQHSDDDRIGTPYWLSSDQPSVNPEHPVTYTRLSFTRFRGAVLTQLNYIIWFPARTSQHVFDLYSGTLDGVNLRITLNSKGHPLLYETIHNCGCFYKAFPTAQLLTNPSIDYPEPPLILSAPTLDNSTQVLAVAMQNATHYVQHLYPAPALNARSTMDYTLGDYQQLRSLEHQTGDRKSLFNSLGTVTNTERMERYILWPTGVYSPGAMRQWGRQPVAFAGERHFDDPYYMEKMFTPANPSGS